MKKKNGFIAISLIYSFFLVFLITLLAIVADYAHNRILLSNAKNAVKEKLNGLSEFNPVQLPELKTGESYKTNDKVDYANEKWIVLDCGFRECDNTEDVLLMLNRNLSKEEIEAGLGEYRINGINAYDDEKVRRCLNEVQLLGDPPKIEVCNKNTDISYTWQFSLTKKVVDHWFDTNELLQKAKRKEALVEMEFMDNISNNGYKSYIRILNYNELQKLSELSEFSNYSNYWVYDSVGNMQDQTLYDDFELKYIRPVIKVKVKST